MQARSSSWCVLALALATPTLVRADETKDTALAESLFREGRALLEAGDTSRSCTKLADSYKLDPRLGTLMNLAACHELDGKVASAWAEFLDAARLAKAKGTPEAKALEATARARAADLEPKIHRVRFEVSAPAPDLALRLDGRELPRAAWSSDVPIDPGPHELEASRPEHLTSKTSFEIAKGPGVSNVAVPALAIAPKPAQAKDPGGRVPVAEPNRGPGAVFWAAAATTVVTAGFGVVFGLRAMSARDDRDVLCTGGTCPPAGLARQDDAFEGATLSTVFFGVAAVGTVVAVTALVWSKSRATTNTALAPLAGGRF